MDIIQILILIGSILISVLCSIISYYKGYIAGFKKCKDIDDEILDKYNNRRNE